MEPHQSTLEIVAMSLVTSAVTSSSDLAIDGWDDLVLGHSTHLPAHGLYTSTPWLRSFEFFGDWNQQYLVARNGATLVGGLTTHRVGARSGNVQVRIEDLFTGLPVSPEVLESIVPCRVAGGLFDDRTGALTRSGLSLRERAEIIDRLFAEAEHTADGLGEKAVICRCVDASDTLLRWVLRRRGYAEFPGPRHLVLTPPAGGLEGYLASFSSRSRNNIRRQIRQLHDANITITVEPLTRELIASVLPLVDSLNKKYGLDTAAVDGRAALETARRVFKHDALAVVATVKERPVGFVEMLVHRGSAWMLQAGFDYEFQGKLPLYFGIMFYGLMDFASSNQFFRIDYTFGTEDAKTSRGCASRPTFRQVRVLDAAVHDRLTAELVPSSDPSNSEVGA